jgi:exodeoxyribonuclease V beta subunit
MSETRILDARLCLELDLTGARLIEASAGTGKTYTIANLYLRQILEGRSPGEVLVVSFTNAATDELGQRIQARLYQALQSFESREPGDDEFLALLLEQQLALDSERQQHRRHLLQQALRGMDEAMISTIHGFCHSALQDHALLSNRQFESEVIESDLAYWNRALKDWWRVTNYALGRHELELMTGALGGLDAFMKLVQEVRRHPDDRIVPEASMPLAELLRGAGTAEPGDEDYGTLLNQLRACSLREALDFAQPRVAEAKLAHAELSYQDQLDELLAALRSSAGKLLAQRLRKRFPVAMIDEFQDTDDAQFEIFRRLYFDQAGTSLTLIGDPKQAIYGFRGGDIFSYIGAREDPGLEIYALNTNWRSTAELIEAVNYLFTRRGEPFVYDRAIAYQPVEAAPRGTATPLTLDGRVAAPLAVWQLPLADNGKTIGISEMKARINRAMVAEITRLLDARHAVSVDGRPLHGGDIAVLVRTNEEGATIRANLADAGIGSVSIGREGVFSSDEARGLAELLDAVAQPGDDTRLRRARACSLFGLDYQSLYAEIGDDTRWQAWVDALRGLHDAWIENGFIAMFRQLLERLNLAVSMARSPNAERRLTNLSQLAEILQRQSRSTPGIEALLGWMRQQMDGETNEESELRLESDADLVKIVTIHKSKGLEYPLVFLPFMWHCRATTRAKIPLRFHDAENRGVIDLGSAQIDRYLPSAEKERLAEDLRLLYVALTRARSRLYLAWGDVGDGRSSGQPSQSALGYLLYPRQSAGDLEHDLPRAFADRGAMLAELADIAAACPQIELTGLPDETLAPTRPADPQRADSLAAREFTRHLGPAWRINSFSSLTRDVHQAPLAGERSSRGDPILDFPAGSHVGLLLHELLEEIEFDRDIDAQSEPLIAARAPVYGLDSAAHRQTLAEWLKLILETGLGPAKLNLGKLASEHRLNELKFDLALDRCDVDALNRLLQQSSPLALQPIDAADFRGLLTGIIDLVFEFRGKYYLADYKSNFLGASLADYCPEALDRAMFERRYDLQALLYSMALHRYLRQRLPAYDYEKHFGGSFYLFLRAMRPQHGPAYGVHFDRPPLSIIEALDDLFAFGAVEGAVP